MSAGSKISEVEPREAAWTDFLAAVRPRMAPGTKLTERETLGPKTTMRVGGPARVYAEPATVDELRHLLVEAKIGANRERDTLPAVCILEAAQLHDSADRTVTGHVDIGELEVVHASVDPVHNGKCRAP